MGFWILSLFVRFMLLYVALLFFSYLVICSLRERECVRENHVFNTVVTHVSKSIPTLYVRTRDEMGIFSYAVSGLTYLSLVESSYRLGTALNLKRRGFSSEEMFIYYFILFTLSYLLYQAFYSILFSPI